jgi:hypothetical protein
MSDKPSASLVVFAGGALLLALSAILLGGRIGGVAPSGTSNAVWFVGLLVAFAAAMTLVTAVLYGLGLSNGAEAFGLPSGTVRTLLAMGIMVLFAVFGMTFFKAGSEAPGPRVLKDPPPIDIAVPVAQMDADLRRYQEQGFLPVVIAPGKAAVAQTASASAVDAVPATVRLFVSADSKPAPAWMQDMQKQVITSIIALLTTVLGFYFGSRSSLEGIRERGTADDKKPGDAATGEPAGPKEKARLAALKVRWTQAQGELGVLKAKAGASTAANAASLATGLDQRAGAVPPALAAATAKVDALGGLAQALAKAADGAAKLSAQAAMDGGQAEATAALDVLEDALKSLATAGDAIRGL